MWPSKKTHPLSHGSYAVTTGVFAGEILIYIDAESAQYNFLSVPKMMNRSIPADKFTTGLQNKIVEYIEQIPRGIHNTCKLQFKKNSSVFK